MKKTLLILCILWTYRTAVAQTYHNITSDPSTPGNGTISIGATSAYQFIQSHANQPLQINPLGNSINFGGALNGTSATFNGTTRLSGNVLIEGVTEAGHVLKLGGVQKWQAYAEAGSYRLYNYTLSTSALAINNSTNAITFYGGLSGTSAIFSDNVGIGTTTPDSKLTVAGTIHSQEVKVSVNAGADFVFDKEYKLRSLAVTEQYIRDNKHLPEIASAEEMKKNGLELGEMNIKLLQKIEELTLNIIDLKKEKDKEYEENLLILKEQSRKIAALEKKLLNNK